MAQENRGGGAHLSTAVALTFDDGYLEHFEIAQRLSTLGVKATFFIITGLDFWHGHSLLARKEGLIKEMSEMGHEIGSHSVSHPRLPNLNNELLARELARSRRALEEVTGRAILSFAYPYGDFDERCKTEVSKYYAYARTAEENSERDSLSVGIKHPGRNLAYCSVSRPLDIRRGGSVLLFHYVPLRSVSIWVRFLKLTGTKFVTFSELVAARRSQTRASPS